MNERELTEMLDRIELHCNEIYVRGRKDGVLGTYLLTELSVEQALDHVFRWIRVRMGLLL